MATGYKRDGRGRFNGGYGKGALGGRSTKASQPKGVKKGAAVAKTRPPGKPPALNHSAARKKALRKARVQNIAYSTLYGGALSYATTGNYRSGAIRGAGAGIGSASSLRLNAKGTVVSKGGIKRALIGAVAGSAVASATGPGGSRTGAKIGARANVNRSKNASNARNANLRGLSAGMKAANRSPFTSVYNIRS